MELNYFDKMILNVIDSIEEQFYDWPGHWTYQDKIDFLDECLEWLEQNELYERCQLIIDAKKEVY